MSQFSKNAANDTLNGKTSPNIATFTSCFIDQNNGCARNMNTKSYAEPYFEAAKTQSINIFLHGIHSNHNFSSPNFPVYKC